MHLIKLTLHRIVHQDIQEVATQKQQNTNISSAEVCQEELGCGCSADFIPDAKHLSGVEESAFADVLCKAASIRT